MTAARYAQHRTALAALVLTAAAALGLAACAAASAPRASVGGAPVSGGTAYFAEQPLAPPTCRPCSTCPATGVAARGRHRSTTGCRPELRRSTATAAAWSQSR